MKIYAISDLHLSENVDKPMNLFGDNWNEHNLKIKENWESTVTEEDLVLIPGDISWAMTLEDACYDLDWVGRLPGKKVIIRGNHDYWWKSLSQLKTVLPSSVEAIQNDSILIGDIAVAGVRLWDDPQISFFKHVEWVPREDLGLTPKNKKPADEDEKIFTRELKRLEISLESVSGKAKKIIALLHYPPTDFTFCETRTTQVLQKFGVDVCVFGHLHSLKKEGVPVFPVRKWGIDFYLVSSDFVDFSMVEIKI